MKKPAFFISSTIFDFKDLRSSLKWWLEDNDYIVNASEFNDFEKSIDENSYEACLKAIDNSDYFILLIGDRTGGMYDDKTTITQKEYQYAYERMLSGKLKIINFIRHDTWLYFNTNRKNTLSLKPEDLVRFSFIDEVRRFKEMKEGSKPKGNWIHVFSTFADIVAVFRNELGDRFGLSFKQNRFIILNDIQRNLRSICSKEKGEITPIGLMSSELWKDFQIKPEEVRMNLSSEQHINYAMFYVECMQLKPFRTNRIESFYKAGFFLKYDKDINDFTNGDLNQMALNLLNTYDRLNTLTKSLYEDMDKKLLTLGKKPDKSHLNVTVVEIFLALELYDEILNCFNLSINLYRALRDLNYSVPTLVRHNRLAEEMSPKEIEIVTEDDILHYLNS